MNIAPIVQHAKDTILKEGKHYPTLFIEFEDGNLEACVFAEFPDTTREKQMAFFGAARKIAQTLPPEKREIRELLFLVEAWTSEEKGINNRKYNQPSDDPNRKEALIALGLHIVPGPEKPQIKSSLQHFEMLRDDSGQLVDLLAGEKRDKIHDNLLPYVLAGVLSTKHSDDELAAILMKK